MRGYVGILCAVVGVSVVALAGAAEEVRVVSPDGRLCLTVAHAAELAWSVTRDDRVVLKPAPLGLVFAGPTGSGRESVTGAFDVVAITRTTADTTWETHLARREKIRDHYAGTTVTLRQKGGRKRLLALEIRAYDEGVAFRYVIPEQENWPGFQLLGECTQFRVAGDPCVWTTRYAQFANSQEQPFMRGALSALAEKDLLGMPVLVELPGTTLALTEAALDNWAGAYFQRRGAGLRVALTPLPPSAAATAGVAVIRTTPASSPWRVVLCGDSELDLIRKSDLILNLNAPPEKDLDFSWVKPGASSWDWWSLSNNDLSTQRTLAYVDLAAEMSWPYHTIDGGWYGFARRPNHGGDVRLKPRPSFDLARIVAYARAKGVGIWVWLHWELINDTGLEETFAQLERWGVVGVKTDFFDRQDQKIVNWFTAACRAAARHHIMINFHGAFKPTGTERTWPNNLTREGVLGNEMTKFNARVTPQHVATLPFTRFLLGPADFTPGAFGNVYSKDFMPQTQRGHRYGDEDDVRPIWAEEMGTRAHALALCVAFDSRLMTVCDAPERYRQAAGAAALRALPTAWRNTWPLAGACGQYYVVARETFDGRFYVAAFTVAKRTVAVALDFLPAGEWTMRLWSDDPVRTLDDAQALKDETRTVTRTERLDINLLAEGGAVAILERK